MGIKDSWESLTKWWCNNITNNQKKLSKGFSWFLVVIISNLITPITAMLRGGIADWNTYAIICTVAGIGYGIMVIESIFGAPEKPDIVTPVAPEVVAPESITPT